MHMTELGIAPPTLAQRVGVAWFGNLRADLLSGTLVALALIPEAIGFSIVAGVDPAVGLYTSFVIAITIAFAGGRPGMISAATGSMAVVLTSLVKDHGLNYLFATTIAAGVVQMACARIGLARLMHYVPRSVVTGFVCALAVVIFMAQLPQFQGANWQMYAFVVAGLAIIYLLPRVTRLVPSPLVAIILLTLASIVVGANARTVSDMGRLPQTLPTFAVPQIPLTLESFAIIAPYAIVLAMVGLLESLLTAQIVDDLTDTPSNKHRETFGQGLANVVAGFFGGMAGCAMIGQTVINIRAGGRTRLSTLTAGVVLIMLLFVLREWVGRIPLGALAAVMFSVCIGTFDWGFVRGARTAPRGETLITLATIGTVIFTSDLALGVLVGVLLSAVLFAVRIASQISVTSGVSQDGTRRTYHVAGPVFFVTQHPFVNRFDFDEPLAAVKIDLTHAQLWDSSAVDALDRVIARFHRNDVAVQLVGVNDGSRTLLDVLGVHHRRALSGEEPIS